MARVMSHWKVLFGLRYESRDNFLVFYCKTKDILHKLKKGNFVIVMDEVFLKAYLVMIIEAHELQTEVQSSFKIRPKHILKS